MNASNAKTLIQDFPRLYRGREKSITERSMPFDFACGDGWFQLIYKLSAHIEAAASANNIDINSEQWPEAKQVKEKFGGLRYYIDAKSETFLEKVSNLVTEAEAKSFTICERCGRPGKLRYDSWVKTLCDTCKNLK